MRRITRLPDNLVHVTEEILARKYPDARMIFLAGSIVRGEGTPDSDLDLVVIFDKLPHAYRESFYFQDFPVEVFAHDPETLNYFFYEVDRPSGIPSLAQMVLEGIEVPGPGELSHSLKQLAASVMELGPPPLSQEDVCKSRYAVTSLVDDIRHPRSREELIAAGTELYQTLADYYFRAHNLWSARGKAIPRILQHTSPDLYLRYSADFDELFVNGKPGKVIALAEEILAPNGGFLFADHKLEAPASFRKPVAREVVPRRQNSAADSWIERLQQPA